MRNRTKKTLRITIALAAFLAFAACAGVCEAAPRLSSGQAELIDQVAPPLLKLAGMFFGVPLLIAAGALWGRHKPGRVIRNLIASVQEARKAIGESSRDAQCKVMDVALERVQSVETRKIVMAVKDKLQLPSVIE